MPFGWAINGANRHDIVLFGPTLDNAKARGLLIDVETLHLDEGYDSSTMRTATADREINDVVCDRRRKHGEPKPDPVAVKPGSHTMGLRWPVERTNSWLSNYGQMRRNTDRKLVDREAALCLAITAVITVKLVKYQERWGQ